MPEKANAINRYVCQGCGKSIVTINCDEGTTPFMLICKFKCLPPIGMYSSFYKVDADMEPTYEWYRPVGEEYDNLSQDERENHVDLGGLLLREIKAG